MHRATSLATNSSRPISPERATTSIYRVRCLMSRSRPALFLAAGLCLASCSPDSTVDAASTTAVTTTRAVAPTDEPVSTTGPTTTVALTSTTSAPSSVCEARSDTPIDTDALAEASFSADLDGDGFEDTITGYLLGSADPTGATAAMLHVELASGWGSSIRVDELGLPGLPLAPQPQGIVTIGGDQLVVAGVAGVLPGELFAFFAFEDCLLRVVTLSDGSIPDIWIGGGANHDDWFTCQTDGVSMLQLGFEDFDADPRIYGSGLVQFYSYADGGFSESGSSDIEAALPATLDDILAVYPICVG